MLYQQYAACSFDVITYYGCGAAYVGLLNNDCNPGDMTENRGSTFYTGHYSKNTFTSGGGLGGGYQGGDGMVLIWYN